MNKLSPLLLIFTLTAVILGGVLGYFVPDFMLSISFIGKLFLNSLKIIAIPFAITMIIAGISSMGSKDKIKRTLGKTSLYFVATSLTASFIGVLLALVIEPGLNGIKEGAHIPEEIVPHLSSFSFNNLFGRFIPDNFLSASIEMQFLAVVLFAFLLGTVLTNIDKKNRVVLDFFLSLKDMFSQFLTVIFYIAPLGLFSLAGTLFAQNWQNSQMLFSSLALFTITIIFGLSFFALVILPVIAKMFGNVSPYKYFTSLMPALATVFATDSAIATLPITEECVKSTSVDPRASSFVLPLGALFNASGTALFLSASTIFIAQLYGLSISVGQILVVIGGSFLIASLTSFIPYASLFMLALVLEIANFPIHVTAGLGILVLVDFLFGRIRAIVDVWSDAVGVAVIGNTFDFKTARSAKAAIPIKRTYNKNKPRTPHEKSSYKSDNPRTKRTSKVDAQSKTQNERKKTKEYVKKETPLKDTKSPFQISAETNAFTEPEMNNGKSTPVKSEQKRHKSPIVKQELKSTKLSQSPKKEISKSSAQTKTQKKTDKPKPIIHKIEVPPLPVIHKIEVPPLPFSNVTKKEQPAPPVEAKISEPVQSTDNDTAVTKASATLSKDTIERERAKIAAQLNLMREKESIQVPASTPEITELIVDETPIVKEDAFTKIDFVAEETKSNPTRNNITPPEVLKPVKITPPEVLKPAPITPPEVLKPVKTLQQTETVAVVEKKQPEPIVEATPVVEAIPTAQKEVVPEVVEEVKPVTFGRKTARRATAKPSVATEESIKVEPTPPTEESIKVEPTPPTEEKNDYAVETMSFGRGRKKK